MSGKKNARGAFNDGSPWAELMGEVQQDPLRRQKIIGRIEAHLGAKVVTLFTAFGIPSGIISDQEAEMLENVLSAECKQEQPLVLIINSPGGMALAAERIANVCRAYSVGDCYRVIVPHMAKSAATMVCFGAAEIMMSKTAELGPVDPQVPFTDDRGNQAWISAEEYLRSYDSLMKGATGALNERLEPYLQQLQRYDSRYVEQLRSAQQLARDISVRLLKSGMLKSSSESEILTKIDMFLTQAAKSSHGRMIAAAEASTCGLTVNMIDLKSELWRDVWSLYVRSDWSVSQQYATLVESTSASVVKPR